MADNVAEAGDGRIVSELFQEHEQSEARDSTVVPGIADVAADRAVADHTEGSNLPLVSITAKVNAEGEVAELVWTINSTGDNRCNWRVPANRLFTGAPKTCWVGGSFRWEEFGFIPSSFLSTWRNSSDMNVTFYKTKRGELTYSSVEVNEWGVWDFRM